MTGVPAPITPDRDSLSREAPDKPARGAGRRAWGLVILLGAYLAVYGRSLTFELVWDDANNTARSELMRGPLRDIIRKGEHARADPAVARMPKDLVPEHESYRPIAVLSHWLDARHFGEQPRFMHAHTLLLGVLSILLVSALARRLGVGLWLPGLWAFHPLHVEVFAYLSARSDLLAAIFSLLALLAALRSSDSRGSAPRWSWAVVASVLHLLSLFCKETNLGLPFAVLALAMVAGQIRTSLPSLASTVVASLAYAPLRSLLMETNSLPMAQTGALVRSVVDCPGVVLAYAASFVLPFSLSPDRQLWQPLVPIGWVALAAVGAALLVARRYAAPEYRAHLRLLAASLLALGPLLLPAALGMRSIGALSDRYVFFPFLFLSLAFLAIARAIGQGWKVRRPRLRAIPLYAWAALVLACTFMQVGIWKSEERLAEYSVAIAPDNSAALYRLATVATSRGDFVRALPLLERATVLDPHNHRALNNLAVTYLNLGRVAEAKNALRRVPPDARAADKRYWYNVASVQTAAGQIDKACSAVRRALAIDPGYRLALTLREGVCVREESRPARPDADPGLTPPPR